MGQAQLTCLKPGTSSINTIVNFARLLQEWDSISCLERMYPVNLMIKLCQVVIRQCEGYTQHKPEEVDYCEPFPDFLHQTLSVCSKEKVVKKLQLSRPYCKSFADSWPPCGFH